MGVGFDNVDHVAAAQCGLPVVNVPAYGTEEVADTAMALILGLYRQTSAMAAALMLGHVRRLRVWLATQRRRSSTAATRSAAKCAAMKSSRSSCTAGTSCAPRPRCSRLCSQLVAQLPGSTLGIIGLGAIGSAVCQRAHAFGMTVRAA